MKNMFFVALIVFLISCDKPVNDPPLQPVPPADTHALKLKDMTVRNLPSPYYHFEYNDSGYITQAGFSGGAALYDLTYSNRLVRELRNNNAVNKDRVQYVYENNRITAFKILDLNGVVYKRGFLGYNAQGRLVSMEWELKEGTTGYLSSRTILFSYYPDGNLDEMTNITHPIPGRQVGATRIDKFSNYDNKVSADGFTIAHLTNEHLLLLPRVKFQLNNPGKNIRTGDGVNYEINYTYTYDAVGRPVIKTGDAIFTSGPNEGQRFETLYTFTYY